MNINLSETINWDSFLERHDLLWKKVQYRGGYYEVPDEGKRNCRRHTREWEEGAFIGNGMTGAMISKASPQSLKWELGRSDVLAHNFLQDVDWGTPRVPIGDIIFNIEDKIEVETMRLSLWNAETTGEIKTSQAQIKWRSLNHAIKDLIIIEVKTEGSNDNSWLGFSPDHGISPRLHYSVRNPAAKFLPPRPLQRVVDGINLSIQTFIKENEDGIITEEGECAVAWKEVVLGEGHKVFYLSITNSRFDNTARDKAKALVQEACATSFEELVKVHREWWHNYYPLSFVSLPDTRWESFYWIQMYKLACATRGKGALIDCQGPWLTVTPWPTTVWNLNVQLSYMPVYTSNRLSLGESLINVLEENKEVLIENAKPAGIIDGMYLGRSSTTVDLRASWPDHYELGNLTWALHSIWRHYKHSMDRELLSKMLYPFLKANINLYLHIMYKGQDGRWHLPESSSPEYPGVNGTQCATKDCNYGLAFFSWGCKTLLEISEILQLEEPLKAKWQEVVDNLVDFPEDENGFMIGADIPLSISHRHFSHLMMFYPLHLLDPKIEKYKKAIEKSINHWLGFKGALQGYSFTGAASMVATLGNGNKAMEYLNAFRNYVKPNTMYVESGPVIETPISCAESIHYLLLQSWGDIVRIFPAVPDEWQQLSFSRLLAEGAFEISATRKNGKTEFVYVKSLAGSKLMIQPRLIGDLKAIGARPFTITKINEETYEVDLKKDESVLLYVGETCPELIIEPIDAQPEFLNYYGELKEDLSLIECDCFKN